MPRKPAEIAHISLRVREGLRRRLEAAATKNNTSINAEIADRLARSFEKDATRSLDEIANYLTAVCERFEPAGPGSRFTCPKCGEPVRAPASASTATQKEQRE
jgi:predicted RNA-binding Zn-ribbon protein involved in translation (DUF1610 family)